jgi:hypothetical protein
MRRLLSAILASILITAGLVALLGSPAEAACPYTGCIDTDTHIDAPDTVRQGSRARIDVLVTADGNVEPKGQVTVEVRRSNGDFWWIDSEKYRGDEVRFTTPQLTKKGKYVIEARFDRKPGSRWADSDHVETFRVVNGRRR